MNNVTFLGNKFGIGVPNDCVRPDCVDVNNNPIPTQTVAAWNTQQVLNANHTPPATSSGNQVDLEVDAGGTLSVPLNLQGNFFYDARGYAVYVNATTTSGSGSNISFTGNEVDNTTLGGIFVSGANDPLPTSYSSCSQRSDFVVAGNPVAGWPANITINNNTLRNQSGGPIVIQDGYVVNILSNHKFDHQLEPPSSTVESAGGAVVIEPCVAEVQISDNEINDENVGNPGAGALELHGINIVVSSATNTMTKIPGDGIGANSTCGLSILGASITNANLAQSGAYGNNVAPTGGIVLETQSTPGRGTQDVIVSGSTSTGNTSGVFFFSDGVFTPAFWNVKVQDNCLLPNTNGDLVNFNLPVPPFNIPPSGVTYSNGSSCPLPPPSPVTCSSFH